MEVPSYGIYKDRDWPNTAKGQAAMTGEEISIRVNLNQGGVAARVWTSDLSYDYVKINAEYRS